MTDEQPDASEDSTRSDNRDDSAKPDASADSDVKTTPDGRPIKRNAPAERWEAVGREAIADLLRLQRDAVGRDVREAVSAIEFGAPVDEVHVVHIRDAIEALEVTVEERLVPLVDGLEPWERTAGRVPYGRMYDALDIDSDDMEQSTEQSEDVDDD